MLHIINQVGRKYLIVALVAGFVQFLLLKWLYPFPDFISDSASYISTNREHLAVNLWPVGYSAFLNFIHGINTSDYFLVLCQYLVLLFSLLYFFYSVLHLFQLSTVNKTLLFIFLFFNPALLLLCNFVLSDALFFAVSIILFSQYLWMLHKPTFINLCFQAVLIGLAFTIRYTAIYYPVVSILAILISGYTPRVKLAGVVMPWLFILPFIKHTQDATKAITGTPEFSVFGGWQLANNALYMYGHIQVDNNQLPPELRVLDDSARAYFQRVAPTEDDLAAIQGTYFIKNRDAILKPYLKAWADQHRFQAHNSRDNFQAWGAVSPAYKAYGRYLILHYPVPFAQYYLWPNTRNYFLPYLEKYSNYNLGLPEMFAGPATWFELDNPAVYTRINPAATAAFFSFYPFCFLILNLYFLICSVDFVISGKIRYWKDFPTSGIAIAAFFLLVNFGFSVFATPVVMRYQLLPMTILFFFCLYMTQQLSRKTQDIKPKKQLIPLSPSQVR